MSAWTSDELKKIAAADELEIAPLRPDGKLAKPITIWVVRVGDDLYVRSYKGRGGAWFRAALVRREGQISAAGVVKAVTFAQESDASVNDNADAAYRKKYGHYSAQYIDPMVGPEARSTTIKLMPH
jgi:hypothetical protein